MNKLAFNKRSIHSTIHGLAPMDERVAMRVDSQGRPVLSVDGTQTITASGLDIRNLSAATDTVNMTAMNFELRDLNGDRDSPMAWDRRVVVASGTATVIAGGTTVLMVDTSEYARGAFLVRAEALILGALISLQLSPVTTPNHFTTVATAGSLILGGTYLLVPTAPLRWARIFATGATSRFTAYYVGQA